MLLTRGLLFGAGPAAAPVAVIAFVSTTIADHRARTAEIGKVGAVQGMAIVLGPAVGAVLAFAGLGPIWAAPVLVIAAGLAALALLPSTAVSDRRRTQVTARPWDPRIWPHLATGFTL